MAATRTVDVTLTLQTVTENITVTAQPADISSTVTIASNFKKDMLELLPVGRTLNAAVLLAPVWPATARAATS